MRAIQWTNGLGWNVVTNTGRIRYEIWPAGSVVRTIDDPQSMTGSRGTHYIELGQDFAWPKNPEEIPAVCEKLWRVCRNEWKETY